MFGNNDHNLDGFKRHEHYGHGNSSNFFTRYISGIINEVASPFFRAMEEKKKYFRSQMMSAFIGMVGWLFLFIGIAYMINGALGIGRWPGFFLLGIVLLLISLVKK